MKIIGLTGSIATGKSTVALMCRQLGLWVHDADAAVHGLLGSYGLAVAPVLAAFGNVGSREAGINRTKLGQIVFADHGKRQQLEAIIHPLVYQNREKFLAHAEYKNLSDKIYIDRSDSLFSHCQIINADEVWEFLKNEGFTKIKLTEITFKNQIGLFSSAKTIVGAHGAGLTNLTFSKSNSNIIEFVPENHPNNVFQRVSQINNLNHKKITSKKFKSNNDKKRGDILIDLKNLKEILRKF